MPITPSQARDIYVTAAGAADVAALAERIDSYLGSTKPTVEGKWFFNISAVTERIADAVMAAYDKAGWDVRRISDRDGPALVFSAKDRPRDTGLNDRG